MYLIINKGILPYFLAIVKKDKTIISFLKDKIDLLKNIAIFLKKNKIRAKEIKGIILFLNSLTFSETRKVLTILNVWGEFGNVLLSVVKKEEVKITSYDGLKNMVKKIFEKGKKTLKKRIILPKYSKEPNITIKT